MAVHADPGSVIYSLRNQCLVALPLWGLDIHLHALGTRERLGEVACEVSELGLIDRHSDSKCLKEGHRSRKTNGVAIHKDEVARFGGNLVHLQEASAHHSTLHTAQKVLAETHWPALAHLSQGLHVLVHQSIDLGA